VARYAVIDTETTGIGTHDRVIEVAVVVLDEATLQPIDEFDTLVNPDRDVGRSDIHGITPSMLRSAPSFSEVIAGLAPRLHGAILVAHNLAFDTRMLRREFSRLDGRLEPGAGCCTLALTGSKLDLAAAELDVTLENHHRALSDARATAAIFKKLFEDAGECTAASADVGDGLVFHRTLRREATGWSPHMPLLRKLLSRARYPSSAHRTAAYFDLLDWSLADGAISSDEEAILASARRELSIGDRELHSMHEAYLDSLLTSVSRDGRITDDEAELYSRVAAGLGFPKRTLESNSADLKPLTSSIRSGTRVCFTGNAFDNAGKPIERDELERIAAAHGLQPVERVTKKFCDLLVAQDPNTRSGKAKVAERHGIPVMSVDDFLRRVTGNS
jgi:DNA polymerase-3 subunit epsilon